MTVHFFIHSLAKRAEAIALVDSGATENFMNLQYMKWLKLPIKWLPVPRKLFNIDGTKNKTGELQWYTNLKVQMGTNHTTISFFLSNLGEHKAILGYSWFTAVQPKINWKQGWIDSSYLPVIFWADNAKKAQFVPQAINKPREVHKDKYFIGWAIINLNQPLEEDTLKNVPEEYWRHAKVFSKQQSQWLPEHTIWDHAIELLPGTPLSLPGRLLPLTQEEITEASKFIKEHLEWNTIYPSWSPYAANFFFVKMKDGKLQPIQDYQPLNKWIKKNMNVSPLIPSVIDHMAGCTLFTKFDIC